MTGESNRCPEPEVLAAFVAGNLSGTELEMTAEHLRTCEDCRTIVGDTAYVVRQDVAVVEPPRPSWSPWWLAAAAAALIGVLYLSYWYTTARRENGGIRTLVAATSRDGRYIEPRMSGGFPWAPLRPARRTANEPLDAAQMKLVGAAGVVLEKTAGDRSIAGQHAAALAHLVAGRPQEAAALLTPLAARASDARIWSDLAAARFVAATQNNDSPQFAQALAAADAALRIDPKLPEALFDRALILERLGLRQPAITAWQQYLAVDSTSSWATEVRQHLRALSAQSSFRRELERDYKRLTTDPATAHALAARFPQEARVWGETQILGRWADAWRSHDIAAADAHLRVARAFGEELAARSGERMLQSAVAAIDAADESRKKALAEAHIRFREAQATYTAGRPADAEPLFAAAAAQFDAGMSPLAPVARYFGANTAYEQGRILEAKGRLEGLLATAPAQLPAHRAQIEWEIGLINGVLGRWGEAIRVLRDSVATFERLGEMRNATAVREILAEVYDQIGEPAMAWHHRIIALREIGRTPNRRLRVAVESIATAAVLDRDWAAALSFLGVELEVIEKSDTMALIDTLLLRARVQERLGRKRDATLDLARATEAMSRMRDPGLRAHAEAERVAVAALLAPAGDAVAMLGRAIEFHRVKGRRIFLPELLLERGRALESVGDRAAAAADYDQAIAELETQRTSIDPGDERWGVFTAAGDLFDNAVALAVARGDTRAALAYAERSRAHALLDRVSAGTWPIPAISGDTVIVEYAALPARLVIFVIDRGRVRVVQQAVARSTLAWWVEQLAESAAIDDRDAFRQTAAILYSRLVAPVADSVDVAHLVVFVPDGTLSAVPFSALVDGHGRYLIEQHAVVVAPSAAVYARLASRTRQQSSAPHALVIAGPPSRTGDLRDLSAATREAEAVAASYRNAVMLRSNDGKGRDALAARTAGIDVIHFVGHAREPESNADAALVTSSVDDDVLNVRDIASMHLGAIDVVVLAACGTARGRPGSRHISVAHAFVAAGVPSVVATLWPIADDPAAEFFSRLHRRLADRVPAAEALRSTQLEWIHQRNAPPGLWAAIETIGS